MICKDCRLANRFDAKSKYDLTELYRVCEFLDLIDETIVQSYEEFLTYVENRIERRHQECQTSTHPTYCDCQHKTVSLKPIVRDLG